MTVKSKNLKPNFSGHVDKYSNLAPMVKTRSATASEASEAPLAPDAPTSASEDVSAQKKAPPSPPPDGELRTRTAILLLVLIFASSFTAMCLVYYSFPHLEP